MNILVIAAIIPVFALCSFIYYKDKNKEPPKLLALIFFLGFVSVFPILICESLFNYFFPLKEAHGLVQVFLTVLFGVALFEEGFKWLISKYVGYHNKEFDEIFDIIVYSVFASLGFACFENVMYVLSNGLGNAFLRAILAVPGHTCFAITMGYFLSKAKVGQINGNHEIYVRNTILSIVVPMILHTFYDSLLLVVNNNILEMFPFYIFFIIMIIVCFITVDNTARIQQNLSANIASGSIVQNDQGVLYYNYQSTPVPVVPVSNVRYVGQPTMVNPIPTYPPANAVSPVAQAAVPNSNTLQPSEANPQTNPLFKELSFCPICGKPAKGLNYCGRCGFKLK
ncbi:MAG: PrsW family intramembrane metalloprotease [Bacilli bacterium]|nr:PrsW family intramembrane metalloprotease [Bacilli bacterium]